ncbi:hypothetical protein I6A60_29355 [Frankia sp. AgB1.9]|uniref:hypothetical protein n=1 Tax=unclassified Frankia TaxID=2632575 RepID=UPI0019318981|nr:MULTISPECIES: hypothetical protein [unclassified Frankia]MBL7489727.1 hypothetical protein [Frankia sp. AgW1.1]MBL7551937.1 hypothetical protein [Frankia sp. AgB1.9]MBL7623224.1 hypothetical protein [Frankia sp. AgB1.8]
MTVSLVLLAAGAGCVVVAGWKVAATVGASWSVRRRWAAGAATTSALLALLSARLGVPGAEVLHALVGAWAVWDWWRTQPPRPRTRRRVLTGAAS